MQKCTLIFCPSLKADVSFAFINLNGKFVMFLVRLYYGSFAFSFHYKKQKKIVVRFTLRVLDLEVLLLCFTSVPYGQYELEEDPNRDG